MTCREFDGFLRGNADELREETCQMLFIDTIRIPAEGEAQPGGSFFLPAAFKHALKVSCAHKTHPSIFTKVADASDAPNTEVPSRLSKKSKESPKI